MNLAEAAGGRLERAKGGWDVRSADGGILARIHTRGDPPALRLECHEGDWIAGWDEDAHAFVASGRRGPAATLTASTFGADAVLRREPDGPEVKLDLRRLPRRRWVLGDTTITSADGDALLEFAGRADPLLLLLALWHVALAEGDDPAERALIKPTPLADRASPHGPAGSAGS